MAASTAPGYLGADHQPIHPDKKGPAVDYTGSKGHIYNHVGGRAEVDHTFNSFVQAALKLLGLNENDDWAFMVDQYDNFPADRDELYRIWRGGLLLFASVTKEDERTWQDVILPLVMSPTQDSMVAVSPYRTYIGMAHMLLSPADRDGLGDLAKLPLLKALEPVEHTNGSGQAGAGSKIRKPHIYNMDAFGGPRPGPTDKSAINFKPVSLKMFPYGTVHGYSGKIVLVKNDAMSIRNCILQLLDLLHSDDWEFMIDIRSRNHQDSRHDLKVAKANYATIFRDHIFPLTADRGWSMFVRTSYFPSSRWEPLDDTRHIIRLVSDRGVGYWKVPRASQMLTKTYGINQPQEDFQRAMKLLFPRSRPLEKGTISVSNATESVDIGFGTFELTPTLWAMVREDIRNTAGTPGHLTYDVQLKLLHTDSQPDTVGVRLIGSQCYGLCQRGDFKSMMSGFITTLSDRDLANRRHPTEFRIWKNAELCDSDDNYAVLKYGEGDEEAAALKTWFESEFRLTNCVHFRPEWATIVLIDIMDRQGSVAWDVESSHTLADFRKTLDLLFQKAPISPKQKKRTSGRYLLLEPQSDQSYVVTEDTTEDEWRKYIYNWFHSSRIYVLCGGGDDYDLEMDTFWGLSEKGLPTQKPSRFQFKPYNAPYANSNDISINDANPLFTFRTQAPAVISPVQDDASIFNGNQNGEEGILEEERDWESSEDEVRPHSPDVSNLPSHNLNSQQRPTQLLDALNVRFLEQIKVCSRCSLYLPSCNQNEIAQHNIACPATSTNEATSRAHFPGVTTTDPASDRFRGTARPGSPFRQDHKVTKTKRVDPVRRGAISNGNRFLRAGPTYFDSLASEGRAVPDTPASRFEPTIPRQPINGAGVRARPERGEQRRNMKGEKSKSWSAAFDRLNRTMERCNREEFEAVTGLDRQSNRDGRSGPQYVTIDPCYPGELRITSA